VTSLQKGKKVKQEEGEEKEARHVLKSGLLLF
jgi:hypothetical protein